MAATKSLLLISGVLLSAILLLVSAEKSQDLKTDQYDDGFPYGRGPYGFHPGRGPYFCRGGRWIDGRCIGHAAEEGKLTDQHGSYQTEEWGGRHGGGFGGGGHYGGGYSGGGHYGGGHGVGDHGHGKQD